MAHALNFIKKQLFQTIQEKNLDNAHFFYKLNQDKNNPNL